MKILDGKLVSDFLKENLKNDVELLVRKPKLVVIQVGDNQASNVYIRNKEKVAFQLGIHFDHLKYEEDVLEDEIILKIKELNADNEVDGIIVQLPLSKHFNVDKIINSIADKKDVDGLTTVNIGKLFSGQDGFISCTPLGIMKLFDYYKINLEGKKVTIVGKSNLVGKPLIELCLRKGATVSVCHSKTISLKEMTENADILISATGVSNLISKDMIKKDAIIIDVGINRDENNKIVGDVNYLDVIDKVAYITPVPGGVGPMTIAMLYSNLLQAYQNNN